MTEDNPIEPTLDSVVTHLRYIRSDLKNINNQLKTDYVKKAEFTPVKNLVFGFSGLLLTGVVITVGKLIFDHLK